MVGSWIAGITWFSVAARVPTLVFIEAYPLQVPPPPEPSVAGRSTVMVTTSSGSMSLSQANEAEGTASIESKHRYVVFRTDFVLKFISKLNTLGAWKQKA